ncbi:MAG: hypothetical protein JXR76_01070 [Deltaproteobacteria bacterium]|nr:hypothetical protein [Deltaproteobacteria bacterium]
MNKMHLLLLPIVIVGCALGTDFDKYHFGSQSELETDTDSSTDTNTDIGTSADAIVATDGNTDTNTDSGSTADSSAIIGSDTSTDTETATAVDTGTAINSAADTETAKDTNTPTTGTKQLGAPCGNHTDCASTYCANGVCCQSDCADPCQQCDTTGECSITPANDTECSPITCKENTPCAIYTPPSQICKAFGECNTQEDCTAKFTPAASRTQCGDNENDVCDGNGECEFRPAVDCGSAGVCDAGNHCCVNKDGDGICAEDAMDCPVASSKQSQLRLVCDSSNDCTGGELCAFFIVPHDVQCFTKCESPDIIAEETYLTPVCLSDSNCAPPTHCEPLTGGFKQYLKGYCTE